MELQYKYVMELGNIATYVSYLHVNLFLENNRK